ncbi:hypothetical protein BDA96_07G143400 [Sorghum bicolor]|uniref:Ubiquitin receptor RAD23 n=1 Tax=Sorghum bicolor TaxID=4558 RepID=A0A921U9R1_SORBI|nr:hypothetical protein BDA96_07G143400 [Sorghum bicolor]KAG0523674.1 hypothetical protein BDA96_07G143400 [Sorghum bicolor]
MGPAPTPVGRHNYYVSFIKQISLIGAFASRTGEQNLQITQLIQENQAEFLRVINDPAGRAEESLPDQFGGAGMHRTIAVKPEENEAIQRLEQMTFDRDLVLEVFFACNKDEHLAANYLLDHMST